jgi:hypothetical protein
MMDRDRDDLKDLLTGEFSGLPRYPGDWLSGPINIPPEPVTSQPEIGGAQVTEESHEHMVKKPNAQD